MKLKYINETDSCLINGKIHDVISAECGWYRIIDNSGEDYLYPPEEFEVVEE